MHPRITLFVALAIALIAACSDSPEAAPKLVADLTPSEREEVCERIVEMYETDLDVDRNAICVAEGRVRESLVCDEFVEECNALPLPTVECDASDGRLSQRCEATVEEYEACQLAIRSQMIWALSTVTCDDFQGLREAYDVGHPECEIVSFECLFTEVSTRSQDVDQLLATECESHVGDRWAPDCTACVCSPPEVLICDEDCQDAIECIAAVGCPAGEGSNSSLCLSNWCEEWVPLVNPMTIGRVWGDLTEDCADACMPML